MRVSDLTRPKPTSAVVDLGDGDTLTVIFDRNKVTPRWSEDMQQQADDRDPLASSRMLADLILEWDVTQDDGSPFPPVAENMAVFSLAAQARLMREIVKASMPTEEEGKALGVQPNIPSSDSTPQQPTSQNGPPTSPSPSVSTSPSPL